MGHVREQLCLCLLEGHSELHASIIDVDALDDGEWDKVYSLTHRDRQPDRQTDRHTHTHMYIRMKHTYVRTYIHTYIHTYTRIYIHTYIRIISIINKKRHYLSGLFARVPSWVPYLRAEFKIGRNL
jgi:hypothetical protein